MSVDWSCEQIEPPASWYLTVCCKMIILGVSFVSLLGELKVVMSCIMHVLSECMGFSGF